VICNEYCCPKHGRFDCLVDTPAPDAVDCPECEMPSPWVISAPYGRLKRGEVTQGRVAEPEHPGQMDTRPLADGMPLNEWKKQREKVRRDQTLAKLKREGM